MTSKSVNVQYACINLNIKRKRKNNLTSMYSTPMSIRLSAILWFENKLISPPDPTGDWSISQGDFIKILYLFCPLGKLLITGSFSSSKNHTWKRVKIWYYAKSQLHRHEKSSALELYFKIKKANDVLSINWMLLLADGTSLHFSSVR